MSLDTLYKVKQFSIPYNDFAKAQLTTLANKIILDSIHEQMRKKGYSKKIIESTYVKSVNIKDGLAQITITSEYTSEDGFDVSTAIEQGTKPHKISPKNKKALSWITRGVRLFSAGHIVSGIKPHRIIQKTSKQKYNELIKEWNKTQDKKIGEIIHGL